MHHNITRFILGLSLILTLFASCKKTDNQQLRDEEKALLAEYIDKYHKGAIAEESGLYIIKKKTIPGGDTVKSGNYVKIFYEGYLIADDPEHGVIQGRKFDSSGDYEPFAFTVGTRSVISGWDEAILKMKEGEEAIWIIPSAMAYGGTGNASIPAYSTLIFNVRVYKVYTSADDYPSYGKVRP